ncbi:hypothetical protein AGIG_G6164 [Arapaima gigas]
MREHFTRCVKLERPGGKGLCSLYKDSWRDKAKTRYLHPAVHTNQKRVLRECAVSGGQRSPALPSDASQARNVCAFCSCQQGELELICETRRVPSSLRLPLRRTFPPSASKMPSR